MVVGGAQGCFSVSVLGRRLGHIPLSPQQGKESEQTPSGIDKLLCVTNWHLRYFTIWEFRKQEERKSVKGNDGVVRSAEHAERFPRYDSYMSAGDPTVTAKARS
ncbi:hypothetical protein Q8A73_020291 [Channa argus]|nr:hypothetical protein Q8A73_020291 [Channa argus]